MSDEQRLSQTIVQQLRDKILFGQIVPGEKMVSQRQLAADQQVSRSTVREAFTRLEQQGLIETRHGAASRCCNLLEPHFKLTL
ncbi:MAG: winged helix-turn-helix transcriptional regulator, partial [Oceanospirillaceae bacterium]|nr:winged helix-turn-helix transcriptional regulator [Oceanospirillaceae bacterium]